MTREASGAVKPYILIKDSQGEIFQALYMMNAAWQRGEGEAKKVRTKFEFNKLSAVAVNKKVDPPVGLYALSFPCRAPTTTSLQLGPISFDDTVVEDFLQDNGWHPIEVGDGIQLKLKRTTGVTHRPRPGHPNEWKFPKHRNNLISGGTFEEGHGMPAGWHNGDTAYVPLLEGRRPVHNIKKHDAVYQWEDEGVESFRSISVEVTNQGCWGGWDYGLSGIRRNTDYTISFWYRQPAPAMLTLYVFGQEVPLYNMHTENPMHWVRYSGHIYSGEISGDTTMGFHAECVTAPVKVWIDQVEMYDGYSPIGYNVCRMQYYYHNYVYISPDMLSPVGFGFEHLFEDEKRPKEIDYILELPEGVKMAGFWAAYWTWLPDHSRMSQEEITIDGRPYTRYVITLRVRTDYKCRNHVVTIPRRDAWGGCVGSYCGWKQIRTWLSTTRTHSNTKMRYYARWQSGQQEPQTLELKVVRVPKVKPFRRFMCWGSTSGVDLTTCPDLIKGFMRVGINGVGGHVYGRESYRPGDDQRQNVNMMRKTGIRDIYTWFNQPVFYAGDDPEAHDMDLGGKRAKAAHGGGADWQAPGWCLSYRGKVWEERIAHAKRMIDDGVTGFWFNDYSFCNCFCPKCKKTFKEFLNKFTNLPYKDPGEFMSKPGGMPAYESLWKEFAAYHYGTTAKELKGILQNYVHEKGLPHKVTFVMSSGPTRTKNPFAMKPIREAFDSYSGQFYINCGSYAWHGSPRRLADGVARTATNLREYGIPMTPLLAPGLVYMHPACMLDPYEVMKYQILETALGAPIKGYAVYAGRDIDLGVLINMAAANQIISKYEDIVLDGEVVNRDVRCSSKSAGVRGKKLGDRVLIVVSDYSTFGPTPKMVKVSIPPVVTESVIIDADTGQRLAALGAGKGSFEVEIGPSRARVLLCSPRQ